MLPHGVAELVLERGVEPRDEEYYWREVALDEGTAVIVEGIGSWEPDPDAGPGPEIGYREAPRRLRLTPRRIADNLDN